MARLRRISKYLLGPAALRWCFRLQATPSYADVRCDADWAGEFGMNITSCSVELVGSHLLDTAAVTQDTVALSSGEAEFLSFGRGAACAIQSANFLAELGVRVMPRAWSDSRAARVMCQRLGTGRVRHLAVRHMWVQEHVRSGRFTLNRVSTTDNEADIGTKHLPRDRVD